LIGFGSIGGGEILLIVLLALVLFGPRRIPELSRTLGKTLAEFRRATSDFKVNLEREIDMEGIRRTTEEIQSARRGLTSVQVPSEADPSPQTGGEDGAPSSHDTPRDGSERND